MMGTVDATLEPCGYSNNIEDIYERYFEKNNWLMYKSTKPGRTLMILYIQMFHKEF